MIHILGEQMRNLSTTEIQQISAAGFEKILSGALGNFFIASNCSILETPTGPSAACQIFFKAEPNMANATIAGVTLAIALAAQVYPEETRSLVKKVKEYLE